MNARELLARANNEYRDGRALASIRALCDVLEKHQEQIERICERIGIDALGETKKYVAPFTYEQGYEEGRKFERERLAQMFENEAERRIAKRIREAT